MLNILLISLLLFIICLVLFIILQKTLLDKIFYLNTLTSIITLFICGLGTYSDNNSYIDIAIIYSLLSFISTAAYLRYLINIRQINITDA